ncbi:MAG: hypothetical protein WBW41_08150 [Verrucomicrobiia bacterium]
MKVVHPKLNSGKEVPSAYAPVFTALRRGESLQRDQLPLRNSECGLWNGERDRPGRRLQRPVANIFAFGEDAERCGRAARAPYTAITK